MTDDLALLTEAAHLAGTIALAHRRNGLDIQTKPGGSPVTDGDLAVNEFLAAGLRAARPDYGWLSEETMDSPDRLDRKRIFVVDPIDGTVAYIKGRPWWTIALAIVEDGQPIAAVVHAPVSNETFSAVRGGGAWLNGHPIQASDADRLEEASMLADAALLERPIWEEPWPTMRLSRRNSIAYRMALVGAGGFDAAISLGAKWDWDLAAGALIAHEGGALATDHAGGALRFNRRVPQQPSLVCAAPGLHPLIIQRCRPIALTDPNDGRP
ncbi:MAG: 3'(2'),5'-bisphosphate nucleotidase CysQ [Caulobacterales bacterium]|nr:3'(2'),5'-bisphosphate nucleotidase CysQ [Caulobacterales bacterium]